jgi:hypothetical protein
VTLCLFERVCVTSCDFSTTTPDWGTIYIWNQSQLEGVECEFVFSDVFECVLSAYSCCSHDTHRLQGKNEKRESVCVKKKRERDRETNRETKDEEKEPRGRRGGGGSGIGRGFWLAPMSRTWTSDLSHSCMTSS